MIRSQLVAALDFAKTKKPHEVYTYRRGETWYIARIGPDYSNTHKVLEYDEAGLKLLQAKEDKEQSQP